MVFGSRTLQTLPKVPGQIKQIASVTWCTLIHAKVEAKGMKEKKNQCSEGKTEEHQAGEKQKAQPIN